MLKLTDLGESSDGCELFGHVSALGPGHEGRDVSADGLGGRDGVPGRRVQLGAVVLREHEGRLEAGAQNRGGELNEMKTNLLHAHGIGHMCTREQGIRSYWQMAMALKGGP